MDIESPEQFDAQSVHKQLVAKMLCASVGAARYRSRIAKRALQIANRTKTIKAIKDSRTIQAVRYKVEYQLAVARNVSAAGANATASLPNQL